MQLIGIALLCCGALGSCSTMGTGTGVGPLFSLLAFAGLGLVGFGRLMAWWHHA